MEKITLVNLNTYRFQDYFYIGRGKNSILGNSFTIKEYGREDAIAHYRKWLWYSNIKPWLQTGNPNEVVSELCALAEVSKTKELKLGCFCFPQKCHGEVIANAITWLRRPWVAITGNAPALNDVMLQIEKGINHNVFFFLDDSIAADWIAKYLRDRHYYDVLYFHREGDRPKSIKINGDFRDIANYIIFVNTQRYFIEKM